MGWVAGARARLRLLLAPRAAESRMDEEIRFHIEMETERLVRDEGLDPREARRRAFVAFGGVEKHREDLRDGRGLAWLAGMSLDLRLGVRMMLRYPGLTVVGVLAMAVAVAIGTVSFALIYAFVGITLPLDEGDRVVVIQNVDARPDVEGDGTHLHDLTTWRETLRAVEGVSAYRTVNRNLITRGGRPAPVRVAEMTASGFRVARVRPLLGRAFTEEDERPGAPPVVVIGAGVWQRRFAGRPDVLGEPLQLGATTHTVVGVMPEDFAFPVAHQLWVPLTLDPARYERGRAPPLKVFGRLAPGASLADARTQLATINRRLAAAYPESHGRVRPRVAPYTLDAFISPEVVWALRLIQVAISMLLVVIGTNVAVLVYARTASRVSEIAVRTALGASRGRIVGQLFAEALVLSAAAAAVGLGGAVVALALIRASIKRVAGERVPFWMTFQLTPGMVCYVAGMAVLGAVIVGALPALKATRREVHAGLQQIGPGGSGMRLGRSWTALIVTQVAVAVALLPLVVYVLFVQPAPPRSAGPELPTRDWITASLQLDREGAPGAEGAPDDSAYALRYASRRAELVRRLEAEPRVAAVVLASAVPGVEPTIRIEVEPRAPAAGGPAAADSLGAAPAAGRTVRTARVGPDFFRAFGVPVLAGRVFQTGDRLAEVAGVVVNRSFVEQVLGGGDPLGRRIRPVADGEARAEGAAGPWHEIVGVVADFPSGLAREGGLAAAIYEPLSADGEGARARRTVARRMLSRDRTAGAAVEPLTLAVRVRGAPPATLAGRLYELAVAVDPALRLEDVRALDDARSIDRLQNRVTYTAVALVTLSVLLLSAAGIYALVSFTIARRRREIGIRAALGAGPRRVLAGVLARAARQIGAGIAAGVVLAGLAVQGLEGGRWDARLALLLLAVAAFMSAVGLLAALGPARRALRIQPTEALRADG